MSFLVLLSLFILSVAISQLFPISILDTYPPGGLIFQCLYLFPFSYCSWDSQDKNTEVVCHHQKYMINEVVFWHPFGNKVREFKNYPCKVWWFFDSVVELKYKNRFSIHIGEIPVSTLSFTPNSYLIKLFYLRTFLGNYKWLIHVLYIYQTNSDVYM